MHWICLALISAHANICQFSKRTLSAAVILSQRNFGRRHDARTNTRQHSPVPTLAKLARKTATNRSTKMWNPVQVKAVQRSCVDLLVRMARTFCEAGKEARGFIKNSAALSQLCRVCIITSSRHTDQTCPRFYFLSPSDSSNLLPLVVFLCHNALFKYNFFCSRFLHRLPLSSLSLGF